MNDNVTGADFISFTHELERIEKSHYPENEKLKMLNEKARDMYKLFAFNVNDMVRAYTKEGNEFLLQDMTVKKCATETMNLLENFYRYREAVYNFGVLIDYYKNGWEQMYIGHRPFFDSLLKANDRAVEHVKLQEGMGQKMQELEEWKSTALEFEQKFHEEQKSVVRIQEDYNELRNKYTVNVDNSQYYREWCEYISDRARVQADAKPRIIAAFLAAGETTRDDLFLKTKIPKGTLDQNVRELISEGVLAVKGRVGNRADVLSLNNTFLQARAAADAQHRGRPLTDAEHARKLVEDYRAKTAAETPLQLRTFLDIFTDPEVRRAATELLEESRDRQALIAKMSKMEMLAFARKLQSEISARSLVEINRKLDETIEEEEAEGVGGDPIPPLAPVRKEINPPRERDPTPPMVPQKEKVEAPKALRRIVEDEDKPPVIWGEK